MNGGKMGAGGESSRAHLKSLNSQQFTQTSPQSSLLAKYIASSEEECEGDWSVLWRGWVQIDAARP
jgi:hypothetical protein